MNVEEALRVLAEAGVIKVQEGYRVTMGYDDSTALSDVTAQVEDGQARYYLDGFDVTEQVIQALEPYAVAEAEFTEEWRERAASILQDKM